MDKSWGWISSEFIVLALIIVASFCNVSVFYGFYHYLGTIDVPIAWRGFLVGLEPMAAFILRLFILPWLHVRNALSVMTASLFLLVAVSCSYMWALSVPALIVVRILHGTAFVLLTSGVISLVVNFIPDEKSGQGFSILSIATMIPYAVIPPLTEAFLPYVRNEADIYAGVSLFAVVAIVLLIALRRRIRKALHDGDGVMMRRATLGEIRENLRLKAIGLLLGAALFIYLAHATVFYFLKNLALETGGGGVGLFFTLSMATMIAVRLFGSAMLDRLNKVVVTQIAFVLLIPCFIALPHAETRAAFYLLAGLYGLCLGVIMPLLTALLFSASPPLMRGLNTNLNLFTLDVAYFLMPYLGGLLITFGADFDILFYVAAGFVLLTLALISKLSHTLRQARITYGRQNSEPQSPRTRGGSKDERPETQDS
ncbi:MAG: MFS transporter [Syntrophales bacterium]|jgi:MFS family permease|nr:MFS transporter [Syntrophales bacterium]